MTSRRCIVAGPVSANKTCPSLPLPKMLVEILIFHVFNGKKLKKGKIERNLQQISAKKNIQVCTTTLAEGFIPRKNSSVSQPFVGKNQLLLFFKIKNYSILPVLR